MIEISLKTAELIVLGAVGILVLIAYLAMSQEDAGLTGEETDQEGNL